MVKNMRIYSSYFNGDDSFYINICVNTYSYGRNKEVKAILCELAQTLKCKCYIDSDMISFTIEVSKRNEALCRLQRFADSKHFRSEFMSIRYYK